MIRVENIHKTFGEQVVLDGIDIEFDAGKTNLVIGRSGSGKTVLLKILVGLLRPEEGSVWYEDIDLVRIDKDSLKKLRMQVGMLFQGNALFDSMTIEQNIRFPMDMFTKMGLKEKKMRVDYCLDRVSLAGINNKFPGEISGGMQKRVGIARAIVLNPKYLFCDEPNSGLDPQTSITIDKLIHDVTKEYNMTTVVNTHDMNSVMEIGEKIFLLEHGRLAWAGSKDKVLSDDNEHLHNFIFASPFLQKLIDNQKG
ncbi:MAG: ATP-binding cassette domain-containing protein [Lewinellaceae bacterium]|nr:ATP-binding cassette domain-containing protein [Lewinellaceae bacterium]